MPTDATPLVLRAGNASELMLARQSDPVYAARRRWNDVLVLSGTQPSFSEPPRDGTAWHPDGSTQAYGWPQVRVAWRQTLMPGPGPELRFASRDDGLHLSVQLQEDPSRRVEGTLPFLVQVRGLRLVYGPAAADVLSFTEWLAEPRDPLSGPAFTIEADVLVPQDERRARLIAALQSVGVAHWEITLAFEWVQTITVTHDPAPAPPPWRPPIEVLPPMHGPLQPFDPAPVLRPVRPRLSAAQRAISPETALALDATDLTLDATALAPAVALQPPAARFDASLPAARIDASLLLGRSDPSLLVARSDALVQLYRMPVPPRTTTTTETRTETFVRSLPADYPPTTPENRAIYAVMGGQETGARWQQSAFGWFLPSAVPETVYCLPDAYRLAVDETTGLPAVSALLLPAGPPGPTGAPVDSLDPRLFKVRLSMKVRPDFDAARLQSLRAQLRALSDGTLPFADLVLGGYAGARFEPDPSLAGLGELFAGSTAATRDQVDAEHGFTLTYEGSAEFIDLLFQRLRHEGIEGSVVLALQQPGGELAQHPVPLVLSLRELAPVTLAWTFAAAPPPVPDPAAAEAPAVDPTALLPRQIRLRNALPVPVDLDALAAVALERSPLTRRVQACYPAVADGAWPRRLAPGEVQTVSLGFPAEVPLFNTWDIALIDCRVHSDGEQVLSRLFDAAGNGVRGWQVAVECPPLAFFDQLPADDQTRFRDVVAVEIELRRRGAPDAEEVRLTRAAPRGSALLSRTVADFISDRAVGRSVFEVRRRLLRVASADGWSEWTEETGAAVSVYFV